jgi:hypothetical protein
MLLKGGENPLPLVRQFLATGSFHEMDVEERRVGGFGEIV